MPYFVQAIFLASLLLIFFTTNGKMDAVIASYIVLWTIGIVVIQARYGADADIFYSNDQKIMVGMVDIVSKYGIAFNAGNAILFRYVVTIPAMILTKFGFDALLALKFIQATCVLLSYRLVRIHFASNNLDLKLSYIPLFSGPLLLLNSLLGLRDAVLSYLILNFVIGKDPRTKILAIIGTYLLRPHLAAALLFGLGAAWAYNKIRASKNVLSLSVLIVMTYGAGIFIYAIGLKLQQNGSIDERNLSKLNQDAFIRLATNFSGLQFLTLGEYVVEFSIARLLLLRIVFFDTFVTPLLFLSLILSQSLRSKRDLGILLSFVFFSGIVSNTDFNSSRQNIPFIVLMGVAVSEHYATRRRDAENFVSAASAPTQIVKLKS